MRARLSIEKGEGSQPSFDLVPGTPVTLGRSRNNALVLQDEHASRQHAQMVFQDDVWVLQDMGTLNGTYVNGEKIAGARPLAHGDIIGIADMRLRFSLVDTPHAPAPPERVVESTGTLFLTDDLTHLYQFMTGSIGETDPQAVIGRALDTLVRQTGACLAGFLNLDPDHPVSKMIEPQRAEVNQDLSRHLTQRARQTGRTVWLQGTPCTEASADSLASYMDAVCIPLLTEDEPLGAVHVYKDRRLFTPREVQFCEVVAGYTANSLTRLRLCRILAAENSRLKGPSAVPDELIGASPAMLTLRQTIAKAAAFPVTVLIQGESGVGKELVAAALHKDSPRRHGPFVVANCGAFTESLIESQLFGHTKGAFTGALANSPGYFQQADDGTLFLDEIGDMPFEGQVKLLRVIEGKPFRPVGGMTDLRTDVRVVAATNKDLEQAVSAKEFRSDLYFRLRVICIRVPPLREHIEDIPAMVDHFLRKLTPPGARRKEIAPDAMKHLQEYTWPGNVRQLRSALEHAIIMCEG